MAQERFRITNAPEALPGSCFLCSTASREFFVDTGMQVEFHGAFYICNECLAEMARLVGFETPGNVMALRATKDSLEKKVFDLTRDIDALERVVDGYSRLGRTSNSGIITDTSVLQQLPFDSLSDERASEGEASLGDGTSESPESSNESGMADVRPTESNEFTLEL
jgi:hypothetical protein